MIDIVSVLDSSVNTRLNHVYFRTNYFCICIEYDMRKWTVAAGREQHMDKTLPWRNMRMQFVILHVGFSSATYAKQVIKNVFEINLFVDQTNNCRSNINQIVFRFDSKELYVFGHVIVSYYLGNKLWHTEKTKIINRELI